MRSESRPLDDVVEIRFAVAERRHTFVDVSAAESCRMGLVHVFPRGGGEYGEFFSVAGAAPASVAARVERGGESARVVRSNEDTGLVELVVESSPSLALAELGALPKTVVATDGEGRLHAEVPPGDDSGAIVARFLAEYPAFELEAKRPCEDAAPLVSEGEFGRAAAQRLTDRQQEALETAYEAGYYDRPRSARGEEVASALGISPATFSQHVRTAERKLVATLYESSGSR